MKVQITKLAHRVPGKQSPAVTIVVLVLVGLLLLPVIVLVLLVVLFFKLFSKKNPHIADERWSLIPTDSDFRLSYKWLAKEEIPHFLAQSDELTLVTAFRSDPVIPFFKGYFTAFKVERREGILVQKIVVNQSDRTIEAMPLYFFNYETREAKEIRDVKGYVLEARGEGDELIITASREDGDLEIRFEAG